MAGRLDQKETLMDSSTKGSLGPRQTDDTAVQFASEILRLVNQAVSQLNRVTSLTQKILDFDAFILANIPYGQVDRKYLSQGLIEVDGPDEANGIYREPLRWYFGGIPYKIDRALRVQYSYTAPFPIEIAQSQVTASLFIGYQRSTNNSIGDGYNNTPKLPGSLLNLQRTSNSDSQELLWNVISEIYKYASRRAGAVPSSAETIVDFDTLIARKWPDDDRPKFIQDFLNARSARTGTGQSSQDESLTLGPLLIEYDGPARDNNSNNPFLYSQATLSNAPEKYRTLLQWFFGGRHYSISKAIRIEIDKPTTALPHGRALFIGYQGPGPHYSDGGG
jgi:hypothetical protein